MPSAGEMLRAERTKRNRSLAEIANETCISKRYLEAIEVDRVQDLPGEFFYRAFLRQYAKALSLDDATTERILAAAVPCQSEDPLPAMNEVYENAQVGKSTRWSAPTGVAIGLLVAVLAATSGLYAVWQHLQAKREAAEMSAPAPPQQQTTAPAATPASQQTASQPPEVKPAVAPETPPPVPAQPASPSTTAPAAVEAGKISLDLAATEPAWVSLSSAGKTVFVGTLEPSQSRQFSVDPDAKLTTGNAGGLEIRMNGKPVGPIGPRGQVRVVVFTSSGAQILPPKVKAQSAAVAQTP